MSLNDVKFVGVPSVHPPYEDLVVGLSYSSGFEPRLDDLVLVLPVGWQRLDQHKSITRTNGQTSLKFSTVNLLGEEGDSSFQFVYVQEKVPVGMSDPFVVDIPYDEESLHDESLDFDITLIKPIAAMVLGDQSTLTKSLGLDDGKEELMSPHPASQMNSRLQKKEPEVQKQTVAVPSVETRQEVPTAGQEATNCGSASSTKSVSNHRERQDSKSDISTVSTDEESFVITEMPPSNSSNRQGDELQAIVTQLMTEKDELSKLFQQERGITQEQENRNKCLQQAYETLFQENSDLKETLQQRQSEFRQLQESVNDHSAELISSKQSSPLEVTNVTHEFNDNMCGERQDRVALGLRYPPPYIPPSSASLTSTESSLSPVTSSERECTCHTNSRRKRWQRYSGKQHSISSDQSCAGSLVGSYDCPICAGRYPKSEGTTYFQRHVHGHFQDEQQVYY